MHVQTELKSKTTEFSFLRNDCGVITALDQNHFLGFQILYFSIKGKVNLTVFDMGLTEFQRDWMSKENIFVETITDSPMPKTIFYWQSWIKPYFILRSPYRYTLWIDTDCIVVGDLTSIFESIISNGLMITQDEMLPSLGFGDLGRNDELLYEKYPVPHRWSIENYCNAGVAGYDMEANKEFFKWYIWMVEEAIKNSDTRNLIGWYDEGAFNWALQKVGYDESRIEKTNIWNRFTICYFLEQKLTKSLYWTYFISKFKRHPIVDDPLSFIKTIPASNDVILHYRTPQKYWFFWKGVTCLS